MEFKSEQKHLLISPRKVRPVADVVKKMTPLKALDYLPFVKKRGSELLFKVVKSAVANAVQKGISAENLVFKEIQIGEGPRLRRGQPVSRGRWHSIKKRMSHICVVLTTRNAKLQISNAKLAKKTETIKPIKSVKSIKTVKTTIKKGKKNVAKN